MKDLEYGARLTLDYKNGRIEKYLITKPDWSAKLEKLAEGGTTTWELADDDGQANGGKVTLLIMPGELRRILVEPLPEPVMKAEPSNDA